MAAKESKLWDSNKTLKDATPAQRKHIYDRVSVSNYKANVLIAINCLGN